MITWSPAQAILERTLRPTRCACPPRARRTWRQKPKEREEKEEEKGEEKEATFLASLEAALLMASTPRASPTVFPRFVSMSSEA